MSPPGITPLRGREDRAAVASGEPEAQEGTHPRATCRPGGQKVCEQGAEDPGGNGSKDWWGEAQGRTGFRLAESGGLGQLRLARRGGASALLPGWSVAMPET